MRASSRSLHLVVFVGVAGILCLSAWVAYLTRPQKLHITLPSVLPIIKLEDSHLVVKTRADALLAQVAEYDSEVEAFLHYEYLKSHAGLAASRVLLTVKSTEAGPRYRIFLVLDNDLLSAVPYLGRLKAEGYIPDYKLYPVTFQNLARKRLETSVFLACYDPFKAPRLASLSRSQLLIPLARFMVFKSRTDRRVRKHIQPVPTTLSFAQAKELAADILDVARFYHLPLDVFLGIGAMENDYMNVRGDLQHAIWKTRPQRGDIVLKRAHGRVLVSDYAMGVWQITRETLRYAHSLYLKDKQNYSLLPPRLRPAKKLSFDLDNSEVLTTYAGLLLRHLLDRTNGDIAKAVGAYNGSLRTPNFQYAAGVEAVASYARSFLERAANLNGMNVARSWLARPASLNLREEVAASAAALPRESLNRGSE